MLHYHYACDTDRYENERQRVQQAFLMIIHGSSGLRPSSTMRSRTSQSRTGKNPQQPLKAECEDKGKGTADDEDDEGDGEDMDKDSKFFKLRYRDLELSAVRTRDGARYMVRPKFRHFKGQTRRAQKYVVILVINALMSLTSVLARLFPGWIKMIF